jgi:hypothetical protein
MAAVEDVIYAITGVAGNSFLRYYNGCKNQLSGYFSGKSSLDNIAVLKLKYRKIVVEVELELELIQLNYLSS